MKQLPLSSPIYTTFFGLSGHIMQTAQSAPKGALAKEYDRFTDILER